MADIAAVYAEGRIRISHLVLGVGDEGASAAVPACPEWSVHDVVAHVVGVCADILAGNLSGVASEPWTAAQVAPRRDRTVRELIDEWGDVGPQVEVLAANFPSPGGEQLVADLTTHEHDIRGALGEAGARESAGVAVGLDFLVMVFGASLAGRGPGPLEIRAGADRWVVGEEGSAGEDAVLDIAPFELFRALTGRRSEAQLRRYSWTVDPEPYLPAFEVGPFRPSAFDIEE